MGIIFIITIIISIITSMIVFLRDDAGEVDVVDRVLSAVFSAAILRREEE